MLSEKEIRKRVKKLRKFYQDLATYVLINFIIILIWLIFDQTNIFWPKYLIVLWGIFLLYKGVRMGVFPLIFHRSSLFSHDWEERKVREMMRKRAFYHKKSSHKEEDEKEDEKEKDKDKNKKE